MLLTFAQAADKARVHGWSWDATAQFVADTRHLIPREHCICGHPYALTMDYTGYRLPPRPVFCSNECGLYFSGTHYFSVAGQMVCDEEIQHRIPRNLPNILWSL